MKIENVRYTEKLESIISSFNQRMHGYPLQISLLISDKFELMTSPEDPNHYHPIMHNQRSISTENGYYTFHRLDLLGRTLSRFTIDADMNVISAILSSVSNLDSPYDGGELINMCCANGQNIFAQPIIGGQKDIDATVDHFFKN